MKIFGTTIKFYEDINSTEFYTFWGAILLLFIIVLIIGIIIDRKKNSIKANKIIQEEPEEKPISVKVDVKQPKEEVQNIKTGSDQILIADDPKDEPEDFRKAFFKKVEEPVNDTKPQLEPPVMIKMPVRQIEKVEQPNVVVKEEPKILEKAEIKQPVNTPKQPDINESEGKNDYQALLELNKLSGKYDVNEEELKQLKPINLVEPKISQVKKEEEHIVEKPNIKEVAEKIEKDIENNKTIGFTQFEERQEEDAIISYEELIKNAKKEEVHEPIMVRTTTNKTIDVEPLIDNVQDIDDFLRQLRDLRDNI